MSLFGKVETPRAERPGPAVKPLTELSLRVYGARLEPEQNVVRLHAEAKTAFADGTTGAGVSVGFFLNGRRLSDIVSDEYGLALFDGAAPADRFRDGENELVLRAKGFAREVSQTFVLEKPKPALPAPEPQPPALPPEPQPEREFTFQTLAAEGNNGPAINAEALRLAKEEQDYEQAVIVLECLPPGLRDVRLYQTLIQRRDNVRELDQLLAEVRKDGTPEDVCEVAWRLAKLMPNNAELAKLISRLPKPVTTITNSIGMQFVRVPFGWFVQGDTNYGARRVRISRSYYLGMFPVTQGEYQRVMGSNPSYFSPPCDHIQTLSGKDTSRFPVEQVYWHKAQEFCVHLSLMQKEMKAGCRYRLPTEAEWERACRAGTQTRYSCGDNLSTSDANIDNSLQRTSAVGSYKPNAFGLYDMHGNVWEWCQDWYADYGKADLVDPKGPASGEVRVRRGGSFGCSAWYASSACRADSRHGSYEKDIGFRVVCESSVRT